MDNQKRFSPQKSHPYRPNSGINNNNIFNNGHGHGRNNSFNRAWKQKYEIISENSGTFNIHPNSMYDEPFPKFQQPLEIGIILSESNLLA